MFIKSANASIVLLRVTTTILGIQYLIPHAQSDMVVGFMIKLLAPKAVKWSVSRVSMRDSTSVGGLAGLIECTACKIDRTSVNT